ncbi:hypothetical protein Micbo1qcDRAFT_159202, partial [Microdochium bolleyi]
MKGYYSFQSELWRCLPREENGVGQSFASLQEPAESRWTCSTAWRLFRTTSSIISLCLGCLASLLSQASHSSCPVMTKYPKSQIC